MIRTDRIWIAAAAVLFFTTLTMAQSPADSVLITFRAFQPAGTPIFVPGQFNNWGPNASGVIASGAPSQMTFNGALGAWIKTYDFKIHNAGDRTIADSAYQYKFNTGGGQNNWFPDPFNPEKNAADNNNSILRMSKLFWFEVNPQVNGGNQIFKLSAGLVHANSDTITKVLYYTGVASTSPLTVDTITSSYTDSLRLLDYVLPSPVAKTNYVRLTAFNNHGDSVVFEKPGYIIPYMSLPGYVKQGVTLPAVASGDSVSFRIEVFPGDYVMLRVAPLGQSPGTATPVLLRHGTDHDNWWINLKLAAGTYEYLYEFPDGRQIYDPWGRYNGTNGSRFTVGAEGLTADDYQWHSTTWQRPPLNKLVIYEMNLSEVIGGYYHQNSYVQHNFKDLIPLLPYYDSLGINCIELMPINDFGSVGPSGFSWGYDLNTDLALEPSYGTPRDFKTLVDSAHGRGIAIIIDAVFNHLNGSGPLWSMMPDFNNNPYFKPYTTLNPNEMTLNLFQDLDHWSQYTQDYVYAALKQWIDVYKVDGFRYDFTQGIGWDANAPTKGFPGWTYKIKNDYGGQIYQISEHLSECPSILAYSGLTSSWHESFRRRLFDDALSVTIPISDFDTLVVGLGAYQGPGNPSTPFPYSKRTQPVNMTVDHDELSLIYQMNHYGNISMSNALLRDKLYATFMFTSMGIPFIWEGMEHGEPRGWPDANSRLSYRRVLWELGDSLSGQDHFNFYKAMNFQRLHNPALFEGTKRTLAQYPNQKSLLWGYDDSLSTVKAMIFANLTNIPRTFTNVPWLASGTWYDIFDQSTLTVTNSRIDSITIPAYTARVFSNKSNDYLLSVKSNEAAIPVQYGLKQNYPNPFNPVTEIEFDLKERTQVTLTVYDILGRAVATLLNGELPAGTHKATWFSHDAASGVYFYRLSTPAYNAVQKMILAR